MELTEALDRFRGPLVGLIASWGAGAADASDLAQESFAEAYLGRDAYRGDWEDPRVFGAWLRGIAKNRFRNWRRAKGRRARYEIAVPSEDLDRHGEATPPVVDERLLELRRAIDALPDKHRQVVLMHYLEETSVRDVATLLGVSEKAVEGRLYQARKKLKRMVGPTTPTSIGRSLLL